MKRTDSHFTKEKLQSLFLYRDGNLYWKETKGRRLSGTVAGTKSHNYWQICIDYVIYRTHRLVWIYHNGESPDFIDHINGDTFDNRIENLRKCNLTKNQYNKSIAKNNKSGIKGVSWSIQKNKWRARILVDGTEHHIGFFENLADAKKEMDIKRTQLHGVFARHF